MSDNTKIEWTDATWNPITGCSVVSPGCTNCYAMKLAGTRLQHHPSRAGLTQDTKAGPVWNGNVRFNEEWLTQPLKWQRPRRIFVCAHGDLFHENVPDEWIDKIFGIMADCPQHQFQVLTKRANRMREYCARFYQHPPAMVISQLTLGWWGRKDCPEWISNACQTSSPKPLPPLPNVWLGVSVEDQKRADERIPHLLATPAAVRFLSVEPLLGPVDFYAAGAAMPNENHPWRNGPILQGIDWVIVGGESGPDARPMHPDWARSLRDQCEAAGVPFFFKQWGAWTPGVNVPPEIVGTRTNATWWAGSWSFGKTNMGDPEADWIDEPDLYCVGKKAAGRLLDGREWNGIPGSAS